MPTRTTRPGPLANGTLMARRPVNPRNDRRPSVRKTSPTWAFTMERMTGIEPALSAWEADVLPLNYIRRAACRTPQGVRISLSSPHPTGTRGLPGAPHCHRSRSFSGLRLEPSATSAGSGVSGIRFQVRRARRHPSDWHASRKCPVDIKANGASWADNGDPYLPGCAWLTVPSPQ
jgi:hypothetical protein